MGRTYKVWEGKGEILRIRRKEKTRWKGTLMTQRKSDDGEGSRKQGTVTIKSYRRDLSPLRRE